MATGRTRWTCPACRRTFEVREGLNPTVCPECEDTPTEPGTAVLTPEVVPSSERIGNRFRQGRLVWVCVFAVAILIVGIAVKSVAMSSERKAVRNWLHANTETGQWEEVYWWPAVPLEGSREFVAGDVFPGESVFSIPLIQGGNFGWQTIDDSGQVVRLKYRTENRQGATILIDEVFFLDDRGEVFRVRPASEYRLRGESPEHWRERLEATDEESERMQDQLLSEPPMVPVEGSDDSSTGDQDFGDAHDVA